VVLPTATDAVMPEAFQRGGKGLGLLTAPDWLMAAILSVLE
jgi:hypothetical protein